MSQIICVSGGKGGVGKSFISINLGYWMSRLLHRHVLVISADPTNKTVDRYITHYSEYGWDDFLKGTAVDIDECLSRTNVENLYIVPARTEDFLDIDPDLRKIMTRLDFFRRDVLSGSFGAVILDTPAGYNAINQIYSRISQTNLVVATPREDDTRGVLEFLSLLRAGWRESWKEDVKGLQCIVNMVYNEEEARQVCTTLSLPLLGYVGYTQKKEEATKQGEIYSNFFPSDPVTLQLKNITLSLLGRSPIINNTSSFFSLYQRIKSILSSG